MNAMLEELRAIAKRRDCTEQDFARVAALMQDHVAETNAWFNESATQDWLARYAREIIAWKTHRS